MLGLVPFAAQLEQAPGNLHVLTGMAAIEAVFDQSETPVVGEPGRTGMRRELALLTGSRVQREPVRLVDNHRHCCRHHLLRWTP
jgi:hypothetical protein